MKRSWARLMTQKFHKDFISRHEECRSRPKIPWVWPSISVDLVKKTWRLKSIVICAHNSASLRQKSD
jgi:hypothetical protein